MEQDRSAKRLFAFYAVFAGLVCAGALAGSAVAGRAGSPPAGATALCRDGTYSFSQTHSGTCSHHGGVASWLDGSTGASGTTTTATPAPAGGATGTIQLGRTIRLGSRSKVSGCKLGANPDRRCSPGAYYSGLTTAVLCSSSFHTRDIRAVDYSLRFAVEREYGITPGHYGSTLEVDHIVALELGGSNDVANLFPEKVNARPGYHVKDRLENKLHQLVCAGRMGLRAAQRGIATNWQTLYQQVFATAPAA